MPSSGPIVRTGATPEFWKNWEKAFGKKKSASEKPASGKKPVQAKPAKATKKKAARKTATTTRKK